MQCNACALSTTSPGMNNGGARCRCQARRARCETVDFAVDGRSAPPATRKKAVEREMGNGCRASGVCGLLLWAPELNRGLLFRPFSAPALLKRGSGAGLSHFLRVVWLERRAAASAGFLAFDYRVRPTLAALARNGLEGGRSDEPGASSSRWTAVPRQDPCARSLRPHRPPTSFPSTVCAPAPVGCARP